MCFEGLDMQGIWWRTTHKKFIILDLLVRNRRVRNHLVFLLKSWKIATKSSSFCFRNAKCMFSESQPTASMVKDGCLQTASQFKVEEHGP